MYNLCLQLVLHHDTITTVSLLENGPLVASYLSGLRRIHIERSRIRIRIRYVNNKMGGA